MSGISTKKFRDGMTTLKTIIDGQEKVLVDYKLDDTAKNLTKMVQDLQSKSQQDSFKILLTGNFSSGKSALINTLLGTKLLPEKAVPATAIITEVYYGETRKVIMYPKPGQWKGGNAPFDIQPELSEIRKYCTIDNKGSMNAKDGDRVESCFEKMVVYWPLELLKNGVSLVDSPGTNDPYSNDYIMKQYLPKADAVIYCMNGTNAYGATDVETLEMISTSGIKSPIIVTTYFDVVTEDLTKEEIDEFTELCAMKYRKHTDLGDQSFHFVNSRQGQAAKQNNSQADLVASGYYEFEQFIGLYLTEHKGKQTIASLAAKATAVNQKLTERTGALIATAKQSDDAFAKSMETADSKLKLMKQQGDLLVREYAMQLKSARMDVDAIIPAFVDDMIENIHLDGFTPDTTFQMLHPKATSTRIAEECSQQLENNNAKFAAVWGEKTLAPKMSQMVKSIQSKMSQEFSSYAKDYNDVKLSVNPTFSPAEVGSGAGSKVLALAYVLLTGDWMTALIGGTMGMSAMGTVIGMQFLAGIALGIVSLFTPVGLPALVIATLVATGFGLGIVNKKAVDNIKATTVKKAKQEAKKQRSALIENVEKEIDKIFCDIENSLKDAVEEDIRVIKGELEVLQTQRNAAKVNAQAQIAMCQTVQGKVKTMNEQIVALKREFKIV